MLRLMLYCLISMSIIVGILGKNNRYKCLVGIEPTTSHFQYQCSRAMTIVAYIIHTCSKSSRVTFNSFCIHYYFHYFKAFHLSISNYMYLKG